MDEIVLLGISYIPLLILIVWLIRHFPDTFKDVEDETDFFDDKCNFTLDNLYDMNINRNNYRLWYKKMEESLIYDVKQLCYNSPDSLVG